MDIFHSLPQMLVEGDAIEVLAQHGGHAIAHLVKRIVGITREHGIEHTQHSVEHCAGTLQCHDGVFECGSVSIINDGGHLGIMLPDTLTNSGFIVSCSDAVKGNHTTRRLEGT